MIRSAWLLNLLTAGLVTAAAGEPPPHSEGVIVLQRCAIEPRWSTLLGAPDPGVLQDCLVQPGDAVKAGQVLGRLPTGQSQAELALREAQAASDLEVRLNEAKLSQALAKLKTTEELRRRNFSSVEEHALQRLDAVVAQLAVEEAKARRNIARLQARQAEAAVRSRQIVSPHDGVVVAVFKRQGESVAPTAPVFHVVDDRRVCVTGYLDVEDAWRVRPGHAARMYPTVGGVDLAVETLVFSGRVTFVDRLIDPTTQTCKVTAEVENREGRLRSGLTARMEIVPTETPPAVGRSARTTPTRLGWAGPARNERRP